MRRKAALSRAHQLEPGRSRRSPAGRRRKTASNLLSILALMLLIALFLAHRLVPRQPAVSTSGSLETSPGVSSGEQLTPADRQSLDHIIRDKSRH